MHGGGEWGAADGRSRSSARGGEGVARGAWRNVVRFGWRPHLYTSLSVVCDMLCGQMSSPVELVNEFASISRFGFLLRLQPPFNLAWPNFHKMLLDLLERLLACGSAADATALLASKACRRDQRRAAAELAGLESAWVQCNQGVPENVDDLAGQVVTELYEPYW